MEIYIAEGVTFNELRARVRRWMDGLRLAERLNMVPISEWYSRRDELRDAVGMLTWGLVTLEDLV